MLRCLIAGAVTGGLLRLTPQDVYYNVLPLYHGAGGMVVISASLSYGTPVLLRRKFSASRFWDEVREHGVTTAQYIGEICRYLMAQPPRPNDRLHNLRRMSGAGLKPDIWTAFADRFASLTGAPPLTYVLRWRVALAKRDLARGVHPDDRLRPHRAAPEPDRHRRRALARQRGPDRRLPGVGAVGLDQRPDPALHRLRGLALQQRGADQPDHRHRTVGGRRPRRPGREVVRAHPGPEGLMP